MKKQTMEFTINFSYYTVMVSLFNNLLFFFASIYVTNCYLLSLNVNKRI